MGAAFAVENWAAAGFWKELIAGLEKVKATRVPEMPLAFFTWHDKIEDQHKAHVWDELRECYESPKFREEPFIAPASRCSTASRCSGTDSTRSGAARTSSRPRLRTD